MNPLLDVGPEVGPGQPVTAAESSAISSPDVPAELIDRAVKAALIPVWRDGFESAADEFRAAIEGAAPLLVEHGAERERVKWEARLLAAVNREGRRADGAVDAFEALGPRYAVELLRSLLNEEEA